MSLINNNNNCNNCNNNNDDNDDNDNNDNNDNKITNKIKYVKSYGLSIFNKIKMIIK